MQVATKIQGIPCLVEVTTFVFVKPWKGSPHTCPSSDDYYGYTEIEYDVLDRKGYRANWLERKMTAKDVERVKEDIQNAYASEENWF